MATSGGMASPKILSSGQIELNKISWHSLSKEKVLQTLQSRTDGLTERVEKRHSIYGYNEIIEEKKRSTAVIFAKQLTTTLIMILLVATVIAIIGELIDAIVIIVIVILAAVFGLCKNIDLRNRLTLLQKPHYYKHKLVLNNLNTNTNFDNKITETYNTSYRCTS